MNKTEKLIAHFEAGGTATAAEIRRDFGIQEPRSCISRIEKSYGIKLKSIDEDGDLNAFSRRPVTCKRWFIEGVNPDSSERKGGKCSVCGKNTKLLIHKECGEKMENSKKHKAKKVVNYDEKFITKMANIDKQGYQL